jgi:2-phosphosulfolactate phosphatase
MKINVVPFAKAIVATEIKHKTVIVIDVLRATSVMITALVNGAKEIIPSVSIEESHRLAQKFNNENVLLCGERDAKKIEGFNLGNSPLEFTPEKVNQKTIILTTTNGTRALNACLEANEVLIAAFLNVDAVAEKVLQQDELTIVCSGTNGKFSLDDGICAAMILDGLSKQRKIQTDDLGLTLLKTFRKENGDLKNLLQDCYHLNYLLKNGYEKDVNYCLQTNLFNIAPAFRNQKITHPNLSG